MLQSNDVNIQQKTTKFICQQNKNLWKAMKLVLEIKFKMKKKALWKRNHINCTK